VAALLKWAEGPTGCGLKQVRELSITYVPELGNTFADPTSDTYWLVPYDRNPFFTGRESLLQSLRDTLTQNSAAAISQVQAISGLGGIGKTQTAVEYAYRYRDDYNAVFWVRADTVLELSSSFVEIAQLLNLPQKDAENQDEVVQAVKLWLSRNESWLLIFDNADQPDLLQPFQPNDPKGHVLITSRAQDLQVLGIACPVEMETLDPDEALAFLLQRTGREPGEEPLAPTVDAAAQLAKELGYLPLALEQAAAYIVAKKARFQDYLASYQKLKLKRLEKSKPMLGNYSDSVATAWRLNFEQVEATEPAAADLLRVSAVLHPDAIPFELLTQGGSQLGDALATALEDAAEDPLAVNELLEPLCTYSLIRVDRVNQTYGIHRLVQDVIRADMTMAETLPLWINRTVSAANQLLPEEDETGLEYQDSYETWPILERLTPHVQVLLQTCQAAACESLAAARLFNGIGNLRERGQYTLAEPLLQKALQLRQAMLEGDHLDVATSLNNLAYLYESQGRYEQAEPLYQQALAIQKRLLGDEHPDVATSLNNLAALYDSQGRYGQAEPLFQQALEMRKRLLGDEHPDVAQSLNNLAFLYDSQGRYEQAEPLYQQALAMRRRLLGDEHPDVALSLNNLAMLYQMQNRYEDAEPLLIETVALFRKLLGSEHPNLAVSLNNLAKCYREQGNYSQAQSLCREALEIAEQALPDGHELRGRFLDDFATLRAAQGLTEDAKSIYLQALEILEPKLGAEHPWTVRCRENLAALGDEGVEGEG
jgi:tetratricopeptide (TPR) repeat protein